MFYLTYKVSSNNIYNKVWHLGPSAYHIYLENCKQNYKKNHLQSSSFEIRTCFDKIEWYRNKSFYKKQLSQFWIILALQNAIWHNERTLKILWQYIKTLRHNRFQIAFYKQLFLSLQVFQHYSWHLKFKIGIIMSLLPEISKLIG